MGRQRGGRAGPPLRLQVRPLRLQVRLSPCRGEPLRLGEQEPPPSRGSVGRASGASRASRPALRLHSEGKPGKNAPSVPMFSERAGGKAWPSSPRRAELRRSPSLRLLCPRDQLCLLPPWVLRTPAHLGHQDRALPSPKGVMPGPGTNRPSTRPREGTEDSWHVVASHPSHPPAPWQGVSVGPTETPGACSEGGRPGGSPGDGRGQQGESHAAAAAGQTPAASGPTASAGVAGGARAESAAGKPAGPTRRKEEAGRKPRAPWPLCSLGTVGGWLGGQPTLLALLIQG